MMKRIFVPVFFLTLFFIISCQTYPDAKGKLIISNDSLSSSDSIVRVYTKIANSSDGWTLAWKDDNGKNKNESLSFFIPAGKYDTQIIVKNGLSVKKYETGYKNPIEIKNASVSILSFDGKGIYCK